MSVTSGDRPRAPPGRQTTSAERAASTVLPSACYPPPRRTRVPATCAVTVVALACAWTVASSPAAPGRTVAITVDDLPFVGYGLALTGIQEETARLLSALKRSQ